MVPNSRCESDQIKSVHEPKMTLFLMISIKYRPEELGLVMHD